jgi:hypothetical protein
VKKLIGIACAALLLAVCMVVAGSVYSRATATLGATTGTCTWTNTAPYSAIALKRIWIENSLSTATTVTVTRVATIDSVNYTQSVGSVACAGSASGSTASFTAGYLSYGDRLAFAGAVATGATAIVEYEVQQH